VTSTQPSRARSALLLVALLIPTAWLFLAQLGLSIDVENHAMRSVGTPEAAVEAQRTASFGRGETVVVAFEPSRERAGGADRAAPDPAELAAVLARGAKIPGVSPARAAAERDGSARVYTFAVDAPVGAWAPAVEALEATLRSGTPAGWRVAISGQALGESAIAREVQAEQKRIAPLIALGLIALLFVYYRHAGLVFAILAPAGIGIVWTVGVFALAGRQLDPISVLLQPVLMIVGVASGVHWIEAYLEELSTGRAPHDAARHAVHGLRVPAMLAALTTVVGFLALCLNTIPAVVDFGVFAALGVGMTYWIASATTPSLLRLAASRVDPKVIARRGSIAGPWGRRGAEWIGRNAGAIRIVALLIAIGSLAAWTRIRVDNDPQRVLPESHVFRRDTADIARVIGGSDGFAFLVPKDSAVAAPAELALLSGAVLQLEGVAGLAGPPLRAADGTQIARFLLRPAGSSVRERLFDEVESRALALGAGDVRATGTAVQIARDSGRLVRGSLTGLGVSLTVLFGIFWIAFRSFRFAWIAMVPNLVPCLVVYAALALAGRPLSLSTAMISSVLLGLIVDDTIHLLHRYRERRAEGLDSQAAIEHVLQHSGRAVLITSITLCFGFSLTMFGRLSTTFEFGGLAATTIAVAAIADLILLPALLIRPRRAFASGGEAAHAA
jgi:predicted RND superfamily exporter protein